MNTRFKATLYHTLYHSLYHYGPNSSDDFFVNKAKFIYRSAILINKYNKIYYLNGLFMYSRILYIT